MVLGVPGVGMGIDVITSAMPGILPSAASTGSAAATRSSPASCGGACVSCRLSWPDEPRKSVLMNAVMPRVATSSSPDTTSVMAGCRRVAFSAGMKVRCSRSGAVWISSSSDGSAGRDRGASALPAPKAAGSGARS